MITYYQTYPSLWHYEKREEFIFWLQRFLENDCVGYYISLKLVEMNGSIETRGDEWKFGGLE